MSTTQFLQVVSISTALLAAGGIATLSIFDVPLLQSQPASRSLPMTRWLFSRGSHIFPTAALVTSTSFAALAYKSLAPGSTHTWRILLKSMQRGSTPWYIAAAALTVSIGPFTTFVMIPTNFRLIELNEALGGARSARSAVEGEGKEGGKSAEESVAGEGDVNQFRDLSGPQERTEMDSSAAQDREVRELLGKFKGLNWMRAVLMGVGGVVGLVGAVAV